MLNGMTVLRFENMPELARSGGKKTAQCTHCAMYHLDISRVNPYKSPYPIMRRNSIRLLPSIQNHASS